MLTRVLIDSFLFWSSIVLLCGTAIYVIKTARRIFEYEKQVDRSWQDLLNRADIMISRLNEIYFEESKKITTNKKIKKS